MQGVSSFLDVILDLVLGQYKGEELAPLRVIVGVQAELEGDELGRDINVMHGWRRSDGDLGGRRCQGERTAGSSWGAQGRWSARAEDRGADGHRSSRGSAGAGAGSGATQGRSKTVSASPKERVRRRGRRTLMAKAEARGSRASDTKLDRRILTIFSLRYNKRLYTRCTGCYNRIG